MVIQMVGIIFVICSLVSASETASWRDEILKNNEKKYRIAFGESEISGDEPKAIAIATINARAEMAKTFSLKISSETNSFSSYRQSNQKSDSSKIENTARTQESTGDIDFVGLDTSKIHIDSKKNKVEVAAILDISIFDHNLSSKIMDRLTQVNVLGQAKKCASLSDLRNHRKINSILQEAVKLNEWLGIISEKNKDVISLQQKSVVEANKCRSKYSITSIGVPDSVQSKLAKMFRNEGFADERANLRSPASNKAFRIAVKKIISNPETVFEQSNITGKAEITLITGIEKDMKISTVTLRQVATDAATARKKLEIRLDDDIFKGIESIIDGNL